MEQPYSLSFENQHSADAIQVQSFVDLPDALRALGFETARPALTLVGGASGISAADMVCLKQMFLEKIAPTAQELGAVVVDGGTDAGIMRLIGQARTETGATFPLVGVAATGTVILPNFPSPYVDAAPLEPNHTHFVLVPGSNWGDESPWLARVATVLSEGFPSATLVVNGGEITLRDVSYSIQAGRPVITLDGSGRTADKLAAALRGEATDWRAKQLVALGEVHAINLIKNPAQVAPALKTMLSKLLHI